MLCSKFLPGMLVDTTITDNITENSKFVLTLIRYERLLVMYRHQCDAYSIARDTLPSEHSVSRTLSRFPNAFSAAVAFKRYIVSVFPLISFTTVHAKRNDCIHCSVKFANTNYPLLTDTMHCLPFANSALARVSE